MREVDAHHVRYDHAPQEEDSRHTRGRRSPGEVRPRAAGEHSCHAWNRCSAPPGTTGDLAVSGANNRYRTNAELRNNEQDSCDNP